MKPASFDVTRGSEETLGVIAQLADGDVASSTQKAAHRSRCVVVVYAQAVMPKSAFGLWLLANSTTATLRNPHSFVITQRHAELAAKIGFTLEELVLVLVKHPPRTIAF